VCGIARDVTEHLNETARAHGFEAARHTTRPSLHVGCRLRYEASDPCVWRESPVACDTVSLRVALEA
jgi:hypothetical protein